MASMVTVTSIAVMGSGISPSVFGVILLIGLLACGDLLSIRSGGRQRFLIQALNISIIPLLIYFLVVVGLKLAELLA